MAPDSNNDPIIKQQSQQPIVVIVQAPAMAAGTRTSDTDHYRKFFPKNAITDMSIAMIVAGVFSVIIQVIDNFIHEITFVSI